MITTGCLDRVSSFYIEGPGVMAAVALDGGGFATAHDSGKITLWTPSGKPEATLHGHDEDVVCIAAGPDGALVSGSYDDTVKVWSVKGRTCIRTVTLHTDAVSAVAVSPVDAAFVSASEDTTARVWSFATGECVATLAGHGGTVDAVCVLPSGDVVTGSSDKAARVWQRGTWECRVTNMHSAAVTCLAASPHADSFIAGTDRRLRAWRGDVQLWELGFEYRLQALAVSPSGWMAVCSGNRFDIMRGSVVEASEFLEFGVESFSIDGNAGLVVVEVTEHGQVLHAYKMHRRPRLATIDAMMAAWSSHGGAPPPPTGAVSREAALARTLCWRRFCRPRQGFELVEPLGQAVVAFM